MYFHILSLFKKFNPQSILNDSKGFIFSTDLLLSIIIITVIIGISADAIDYSNGFMGDQNSRTILERCTLEAADILIKTPGSPDNWEVLPNCEGISPGLALSYNNSTKSISNTLSWEKINNLTQNYDKLVENKIFPKNIKSNIIIYPLDPRINPIIIHEEPIPSKSSEIVVINRTVQCNFLSNYTVIIMDWDKNKLNNSQNVSNKFKYSKSDICPHQELNDSLSHASPTNTSPSKIWECRHFNTSTDYLEKNDYYLLTDPSPMVGKSSYWTLDTANNFSSVNNSFKSPNIKLNDEIKNLMGEKENVTLWIHVIGPETTINSFKVYLVAVPKNTDSNYLRAEYFKFQTCNFILKTWIAD